MTFHTIFRTEYSTPFQSHQQDHVFSSLQRWYNIKLDNFLGIQSDNGGKDGNQYENLKNRDEQGRLKRNVAAPVSGVLSFDGKVGGMKGVADEKGGN